MKIIDEYKESLFDLSRLNPLLNLNKCVEVNLNEKKVVFEYDKNIKKILLSANNFYKTYGLDTLMLTHKNLIWTYKNHKITSPIFLYSLQIKKEIGSKIPSVFISENRMVNPLLSYLLNKEFNFNLEQDCLDELIYQNNFCVDELTHIGNLNYKKYLLVQDYNKITNIELSPVLKRLFYGDKEPSFISKNGIYSIFPTDFEQQKILEEVSLNNSIVIQGPPGTGKSRTIANILAQNSINNKSQIFISEKRNALKVVKDLFFSLGLNNQISIIHDSNKDKKRFIIELKQSWEELLNKKEISITNNSNKKSLDEVFRILKSKVSSNSSIGFDELINEVDFNKNIKVIASPDINLVESWFKFRNIIATNYCNLKKIGFDSFGETFLKKINKKWLKKESLDFNFDNEVKECLCHINFLIDKEITFNENLIDIVQASSFARLLCSQKDIFLDNICKVSYRKKFRKLRKQFYELNNKLNSFSNFLSSWKRKWNFQELEYLNSKIIKNESISKIEAKFQEDFDNNLGLDISYVIKKTHEYYTIKSKFDACKIELEVNYGIENTDVHLSLVNLILLEFEKIDDLYVNKFKSKKGKLFVKKLDELHSEINQINRFCTSVLNFDSKTNIKTIYETLCNLKNQNDSNKIISLGIQMHRMIPRELLNYIFESNYNEKNTYQKLLKSTLKYYWDTNKEYADITSKQIEQILDEEIEREKINSKKNTSLIIKNIQNSFYTYCQLLETPAKKLNNTEKQLKKKLRKGKTILIKEFSKTRNHKSIRELVHSEANAWIKILKPVLLLSPISVSEIFSIKQQFDWIVYDEASQLKLEDAIPSLQRAERIVIAGDDKQMGTSNFFQSNNSKKISLLEYCKYEFKQIQLNYHYRSKHNALFQFSNTHFYDGKIQIQTDIKNEITPIRYFENINQSYKDGINQSEAINILDFLLKEIHFISKYSIGIITFSEKQAETISDAISTNSTLKKVFEKDNNFIKSIEHVQGEEADIIILSLTKSRNKQNEFSLNFGPINHYGGEKRLNVLFSRSKIQMNLFTSFEPISLQKSNNLAVKLLYEFMNFCKQNNNVKNEKKDTFQLIENPHLKFDSSKKMLSNSKFLKHFNQKVVISLTKDIVTENFI